MDKEEKEKERETTFSADSSQPLKMAVFPRPVLMNVRELSKNEYTDYRILYDEVVKLLLDHGMSLDDIDWVECSEYRKGGSLSLVRREIPIDNFIVAAKNTRWDCSSFMQQMTDSLRIYGKDRKFMICVENYDGQQSLNYIDMCISKPTTSKMVSSFELRDYFEYDDQPKWIENGEDKDGCTEGTEAEKEED